MQVEVELETLRREVSELRIGLQNLETQRGGGESDAYWEPLQSRMKAEMERDNKPAMIGVLRAAVFLQGPSGNSDPINNVYGSENQFGDVAKLPPVEQVIALGAALSNPIGLQAMYLIFKRHYEGQQMSMSQMTMPKSEIATALSIAEPDLEQALLPLVANGTLRWQKNANGSDYYQLERPDLFATLLTLV